MAFAVRVCIRAFFRCIYRNLCDAISALGGGARGCVNEKAVDVDFGG